MSWHSEAELERVDAVLMALPEENEPMLLTEFDGFCAGLITCPEMIPPSAWLKKVWGQDGPAPFESIEEMQATLDLIMAHYNSVAGMLMVQGAYFPVLDVDTRNGDVLWEFWMMGFLAAMQLRPDAWEVVRRSGNARAIGALKKIEDLADLATRVSEGKVAKPGKLSRQAPDLIPEIVEDLNAFAKSCSAGSVPSVSFAANLTSAPPKASKVGRNDPCPCGSGKKFKKCCGKDFGPAN